MGRFCNGLLTAFRVVQYLFSLAALVFGAYITYEMYSMSASAQTLETSIDKLNTDTSTLSTLNASSSETDADVESAIATLASGLIPVLHFLEGTPVRAIIVAAVGLWSLAVITYLFFAHRSQNHQATNKRSIRILLELITLLAWIASIVCSVLLALEFGIMALAGGPELKGAAEVAEVVLKQVIETAASTNKNTDAVMSIVNALITIGALSVASVIASALCGIISFVSLIVACCTSGKKQKSKQDLEKHGDASVIADPTENGYLVRGNSIVRLPPPVPYKQTSTMLTTQY